MRHWKDALVVAAAVVTTAVVTARVASQDHRDDRAAAIAAARRAAAEPGPEHAWLVSLHGTWRQEHALWTHPGAAPRTLASRATRTRTIGGRFLIENVIGRAMVAGRERNFRGFGLFGYDAAARKHVFVWVDNQGTSMLTGAGERDGTGAIVYHSTVRHPVTGATVEVRSVTRRPADDTLLFETHEKQTDGTWFRRMAVTATRDP